VAQKKYSVPNAEVEVVIKFKQTLKAKNYEGIDSREAMIREEYGLLTGDPGYLNDAFVYALENAEKNDVEITVREL